MINLRELQPSNRRTKTPEWDDKDDDHDDEDDTHDDKITVRLSRIHLKTSSVDQTINNDPDKSISNIQSRTEWAICLDVPKVHPPTSDEVLS